jgi:GntR family transcriptional regulator, galactonate operon transcriptional repressor
MVQRKAALDSQSYHIRVDTGLLRPQNLHVLVVEHIGMQIVRGEIPEAESLPNEASLSGQFRVSRTVLREAIKSLASKGLVEARPKIGTRVRSRRNWNLLDPDVLAWQYRAGPSEWFTRDLIEVREIIEPPAARLAAQRATEEEILAIKSWYRSMEKTVEDRDAFIDADLKLHAAILAAAHNELLEQLSTTVGTALLSSRLITVRRTGSSEASLPLHAAVVEAIAAHDAPAAELSMVSLIAMTRADIAAVLHGRGSQSGG